MRRDKRKRRACRLCKSYKRGITPGRDDRALIRLKEFERRTNRNED